MQKQRKEKDTKNKIDKRKRGIYKRRYRYKKQTKVCIYRYIPFQNQYIYIYIEKSQHMNPGVPNLESKKKKVKKVTKATNIEYDIEI